jgi:hypothetical protein
MMKFYINEFIEKGSIYGITIGDLVSDILNSENNLDFELVGSVNNGYYYLSNGFRFGFSENIVDEIGIDVNHFDSEVTFSMGNKFNNFEFNSKKIHEVLDFLNDFQIKWKAIESLDNNYLMIKLLNKNIVFIFDIYEGEVSKIVKSNLKIN